MTAEIREGLIPYYMALKINQLIFIFLKQNRL